MGCNACDEMQANPQVQYFIRVGPANVQVIGCHDHTWQLIQAYKLGLGRELGMPVTDVPQAPDRPPAFNKNLIERNICPECGISWNESSPTCPKLLFNRHILA